MKISKRHSTSPALYQLIICRSGKDSFFHKCSILPNYCPENWLLMPCLYFIICVCILSGCIPLYHMAHLLHLVVELLKSPHNFVFIVIYDLCMEKLTLPWKSLKQTVINHSACNPRIVSKVSKLCYSFQYNSVLACTAVHTILVHCNVIKLVVIVNYYQCDPWSLISHQDGTCFLGEWNAKVPDYW
jgi:hypothetical protein